MTSMNSAAITRSGPGFFPPNSSLKPISHYVERETAGRPAKDYRVISDNVQWREKLLRRLPLMMRDRARSEYAHIWRDYGHEKANTRIREIAGRLLLPGTGLTATTGREEVEQYAEIVSKKLEQGFHEFAREVPDRIQCFAWIVRELDKRGFELPWSPRIDPATGEMAWDEDAKAALVAALARVFDPQWWVRQIRKRQARAVEQCARELRMVSAFGQPYASDYTVSERRSQKERNRRILSGFLAEAEETGAAFTLEQLAELSVSNPANRRRELMTRMRGFEEVAELLGHVGVFITLTCPSKYHPVHYAKGAPRNLKYRGATPRDAQDYLCGVWAKIRSKLDREGITLYGFRVVEPHHDGTPHWHAMLFVEPAKRDKAMQIMRAYALEEDGDEKGADKYRFQWVSINSEKGSATGYIAKYIAKNIDGYKVGYDDEAGGDAEDNAPRVEAWAACWGIRQFQQIGGPSVTIWRELRKVSADEFDAQADRQGSLFVAEMKFNDHFDWDNQRRAVDAVWRAADEADWAAFVLMMGGPICARADRPVMLGKVAGDENQYGEQTTKIRGVRAGGFVLITRLYTWTVTRLTGVMKATIEALTRPDRGAAVSGATAPPWSSDNNCTQGYSGAISAA